MKPRWSILLLYISFLIYPCCTQPKNEIPFSFKQQDIQGGVSNSPPHIAAHLQGTKNPHHKANLAKELQYPTHDNQSLNLKEQNPTPEKRKKEKPLKGGFVFAE